MGTRSITHVHQMRSLDEDESIVCSFYRHWDGYPDSHGQDLLNFVEGKKLVNGIAGDTDTSVSYNRAGTFAVSLMQYIQDESGCEVIPTGDSRYGEEYTYHIYYRDDQFVIQFISEYGGGEVHDLRSELE